MVPKMLGKLFSTAASSLTPRGSTAGSSRPTSSLESVQEDIYTYNLLFPDAETLYRHRHDQVFPLSSVAPNPVTSSNAFDLNLDVELDQRDMRIVIMQETTTLQGSAALLFDSQPLVESSPSAERQLIATIASSTANQITGGRSITSPRRISLGQASKPVVITQEISMPRTSGAFDRRPSIHSRTPSYIETEKQRSAREYREEMSTFSNCMFGSSDIMAYKGTGTKVHIIPTEVKSSSYPFDGQGSLGRSSIRSSKLAQSYTSENAAPAPNSTGLVGSVSGPKSLEKKKVLVTRIFPIPMPNTEADKEQPTPTSQTEASDSSNSYPFPALEGDGKAHASKKPRQKRTPMYAIGLILNLPASNHFASMPVSRSGFRGPSSYNEQESFPSSYSSLKPSGWTVLGHTSGVDSLESSVFSDFDDRIDVITQHWDIIIRTLNHLQAVVSSDLLAMLKQIDLASPDPVKLTFSNTRAPVASVSIAGKRVDETLKPFKVPGTNAKLVQLLPNALAYHQNIKEEVDNARQRIVNGIKTLQVVTRQGRWGIWREEARWVSKWAGGKEEGFFFYNLLTGFLGNHTEWLQALAPEPYRRHHYQQQRTNRDEDTTISSRTIVVANDKMAARRLVFLLSAFLAPNQQAQQFPYSRAYRPGTATSFDGYSQSPNSFIPTLLKEDSLRRRVKRRNAPPRGSHSRTTSFHMQTSTANQMKEHKRQDSDAISLKTANLPIPGSDGGSRKSSAATTTTVTPATTIPHFSTRRSVRGTGPIPRPGSSGSLATDDLIRSLKRGDSSSHLSNSSSDLQGNSRWGSMISGFWSNKRRDSTSATDITVSPTRSDEIDDPKLKTSQSRLAEMVAEAQRQESLIKDGAKVGSLKTNRSFTTPDLPANAQQVKQELRLVHPEGAYESVVKTSINEDGVIDIDVPLPDFITSSFGSTMSSPSSSGYLSTQGFGPGLEGFEHYSRSGPDADALINVGGWLPRYHPDFVLQAVPPQETLEEEIRASMSAEPIPASSVSGTGEISRWVDVCSTLVADATNFTIKRIRCRRQVTLRVTHDRRNSGTFGDSKSQSLYGNPYTPTSQADGMQVLQEEFVTEPVISMEETLIESVERMILYTASNPDSNSSSRSGSRHRGREGSDSTEKGAPHPVVEEPLKSTEGHLEISRVECKKTILGALEEIARQVAESRQDDSTTISETSDMMGRESLLRQGVRSWLASVEDWA